MPATAEADVREGTGAQFEDQAPTTAVAKIVCPFKIATVYEMRTKYVALEIASLEDKEGFRKVDEARKHCKRYRCDVENWRKDQIEDALKHQRDVNAAAKLLIEPVKALEDALAGKQKAITDEQERIKKAADEKAKAEKAAKLKTRMDALQEVKAYVPPAEVEAMDDAAFTALLDSKRQAFEQEIEARKAREAAQAMLTARMAKLEEAGAFVSPAEVQTLSDSDFALLVDQKIAEKQERDLQAAALAEQQRQLQEQQAALEAQKQEQAEREAEAHRRIDEENERLLAVRTSARTGTLAAIGVTNLPVGAYAHLSDEQFSSALEAKKVEIAERKERESEEAHQQAEREEAARLLAESQRPDREKLASVADAVLAIVVPEVDESLASHRLEIVRLLTVAAHDVHVAARI